jgi:hypothetical protein
MEIIQTARKGKYMNGLEKYHIYRTHRQGKQINEVLFDPQNPIFDAIYNHFTK